MANSEAALPSSEAWQAESLRVTVFPTEDFQAEESDWWQELVGSQPDKRTKFPARGAYRDEGKIDDRVLRLEVERDRIDWHCGPVYQEADIGSMKTLGEFVQSIEQFVKFLSDWLDPSSCPPVQRLAFGAILLQPADSRESGYKMLDSYLPSVSIDPHDSSELFYQINRPRRCSLDGLDNFRINRMSKWYLASLSFGRLEAGRIAGLTATQRSACRLELDISTDKEFDGRLPTPSKILDFLVDLGKEIAERGDIA